MALLLATILPSILIILFFVYSDKFKEPRGEIIKVFFYGILITIPAYFLNTYIGDFFYASTRVSENLISSFLTAAPVEEGLKLSVLYYFVYKMKDFNEPMDGIVYGVTVSLGFATLENYEYVFIHAENWEIDPYQMAVWRSYSAVPMHGLMGCIMGFYFGMYAFTANKKYLVFCLFIPFIIHGFYNFLPHPSHFMVLGIVVIYSIALHSQFKKMQWMKNKEKEIKKV